MGAYQQRVLDLFDLLDTHRTGGIDASDLRTAASSATAKDQAAVQAVNRFILALIDATDTNKDGRVHQQEMLAYLERKLVGKSPEEVPDYIRAFTAATFGFMDYDKTGKVSRTEFERFLKSRNITDKGAADEFARLDRNGSGSFTLDDLHAATYSFFTGLESDCPTLWVRAAVTI
ncbi:EF-hand domain-containing protein [Streptomyces sp. DSM 15324]|uniref:EF-hand domain-containing protein n=1 Tax=Streptomyces sp. DSM 15324 TaxID=1739111 RepID=UPI00074A34B8|nr:EF-hand domain-containing protein [Streptomyces sp. DSM 15324]KUO08023.1 hypothetical protein AQJ58_32185 [Streptomyces sp. DSM 15324]